MINIFHCRLSQLPDALVDQYLQMLPARMKNEVVSYLRPADQKARLLARLMLLKAVKDENRADVLAGWKKTKQNKPFLEGWDSFNISHSGDVVLFCHGKVPLGIDIEKKADIHYDELLRYFHPAETRKVEESTNKCEAFYDIWVRKESALKALGSGLANGLNKINCLPESIFYDGKVLHFYRFEVHPEYAASLCCADQRCKIRLMEFRPEELLKGRHKNS